MIVGCEANEEEQELIDNVELIYRRMAEDKRNGRGDRTEVWEQRLQKAQEHYQRLQTAQKDACNALLDAAACGNYPEVRRLLEEDCSQVGVTVDGHDKMTGGTPLIRAACNGHIEVAKILVHDFQANVEKKDYTGMTPLMVACVRGQTEMVQFLIQECRAEINATSLKGNTALMHAAYEGHFELVKLLMEEFNANTKVKSEQGLTLMHFASMGGHPEIVQYLIALDPANPPPPPPSPDKSKRAKSKDKAKKGK